MVCYESFGDGEVIIKASEQATGFVPSENWNKVPQGMPQSLAPETVRIWETKLDPDKFSRL